MHRVHRDVAASALRSPAPAVGAPDCARRWRRVRASARSTGVARLARTSRRQRRRRPRARRARADLAQCHGGLDCQLAAERPLARRRRQRPQRYWPVFDTVSIERPGSVPCLPVMSVRMKTIRSPFLPEMRAQSSGLVVFGQVLVLLELVDAGLEHVRDPQALLVVVEEVLDRHLLGAVDDVLDHRAGVEVLEVQDLLVAVGVGHLEEAVLLGLGVHPLDGAPGSSRRRRRRRSPPNSARSSACSGSVGGEVLAEDVARRLGVGALDLDLHVEPARAAGSPGRSCPRGWRRR